MRLRAQSGSAAHAAFVAAVALLASAGVLVALAVALPVAFDDEASPAVGPATRAARPAEAEAAVDKAVAALRAADEDAWRVALPASGDAARRAMADLFDTLSGLPRTTLEAVVQPIPSRGGRYDIRLLGTLAGAGPADRLVAERVLDLEVMGPRVVATGDATPKAARELYLMAFDEPRVVEHDACVIITEPKYTDLAEDLATAAGAARGELAMLGVDPDRAVVLYLYATRAQLRDALGGGPTDERFEFFSAPVARESGELGWPRDINILAPALEGEDEWLSRLLAHELTHAFTVHWFADTANDPMFLAEGMAVAVEGGRSYDALRAELAGGNERLPLATAIGLGSLWSGNADDKVQLAYLEAGSVVLYILDEWGLEDLKRWILGVADSDLTPDGVAATTRRTLGVTWDAFVAGWTEYVQTLP